jgi:hypothetical protein
METEVMGLDREPQGTQPFSDDLAGGGCIRRTRFARTSQDIPERRVKRMQPACRACPAAIQTWEWVSMRPWHFRDSIVRC